MNDSLRAYLSEELFYRWADSSLAVVTDSALVAQAAELYGDAPSNLEPRSVDAVNDSLRAYLSEELFYRWADSSLAVVTDSALVAQAAELYGDVILTDSAAGVLRD